MEGTGLQKKKKYNNKYKDGGWSRPQVHKGCVKRDE